MRFWDSSALVPLFAVEPATPAVLDLIAEDPDVSYWWTAPVECASAFARERRAGLLDARAESNMLAALERARSVWIEIQPHEALRRRASQLLRVHALRAADAFQLAAALAWSDAPGSELVTFDDHLADAARLEGFDVLPAG